MNLHTRILLGYGYLVSLLVLSAAGAALGFRQLGTSIGRILTENFESVRSSMMMLEALERQDSAVLGKLLGKEDSEALIERSDENFALALELARARISLQVEEEIVAQIKELLEQYHSSRDALLSTVREHPLAEYERETFPRFEAVKVQVLRLLDVNHEAMLAADRNALQSANLRAVIHGSLVALALISLGFLSYGMRHHLLDRLEELRSVAEAIASGDRSRRATVTRRDELGVVAAELNSMLDKQRELEGMMEGRLGQQRQLLLGLLRCCDENSALLSVSGDIVASTVTGADEKALFEVTGELDVERSTQEITQGDRRFCFKLLDAGPKRPVGWLATVHPLAQPSD